MGAGADYINMAICAAAALAMSAAAAFLSMFSFAVAAYRFAPVSDGKSKGGLDPAAKRLVYASDKIAAVVNMARRFAFAAGLLALFGAFCGIENLCGAKLSGAEKMLYFLPAACAAAWLQYAAVDMAAARIGKNNAEAVLAKYSKAFYFVYILMLPLYFLSRAVSGKIAKKLPVGEDVDFESVDVELMLSARDNDAGSISPYTGKIVRNAVKLQELDVSDVMLPRSKVHYFDIENSNAENLQMARATRHARYPLCRGDLDGCLGIIYSKDIFMSGIDPEKLDFMSLRRDAIRVRENEKLESALAKLIKYRLQMAIVEDEFGGVIGALTLGAALSELVGQIRSESADASKESIIRLGKNKYKIMGSATLHKVEDFLGVDFDADENSSTFGGLITYTLGRFPEAGEQISFPAQRIRVAIDKTDERSVVECTVFIELNEEQK